MKTCSLASRVPALQGECAAGGDHLPGKKCSGADRSSSSPMRARGLMNALELVEERETPGWMEHGSNVSTQRIDYLKVPSHFNSSEI